MRARSRIGSFLRQNKCSKPNSTACLNWLFYLVIHFIIGTQQLTAGQHKHAIFLEIGGSGGLASVNHEWCIKNYTNAVLKWRSGLSFAPVDKNNGTGIVFPLMLTLLSNTPKHHWELGIGQGITITTKGHFFVLGTAAIGYRYQHEQKPIFYRIAYTPLISYLVDVQYQNWGGISIGYQFK